MAAMRTGLRKSIANAPIAGDPPRQNGVVGSWRAEIFLQGFVPILGSLGARRLHRAEFVGAARLELALFPVPLPVETKASVRHGIRRGAKLRVLPRLAAIAGNFHF